MYEDFARREGGSAGSVELAELFIGFLENRYEPWKVKQACHALQLYEYYHSHKVASQARSPLASHQAPLAISVPAPGQATGRPDLSVSRRAPQGINAPVSRPTAPLDWKSVASIVVSLMRMRHYSLRTEKAYLSWIRRFRTYVQELKPAALTDEKLRSFLSYLAVEQKVAAATQKLAFNALLFLYRNVLGVEIKGLASVVPSHVPRRLPVVLTIEELRKILSNMNGTNHLMATLIYGGGLRLQECLSLRIKDLDFSRNCLTIRGGKGDKDRQTLLPEKVCSALKSHLENVQDIFDKDRKQNLRRRSAPGCAGTEVPICQHRVGLVLGVPLLESFGGSPLARGAPTSRVSLDASARIPTGCVELRHYEARNNSYAQA